MPYHKFDRNRLLIKKLSERKDKVEIERDNVPVSREPMAISGPGQEVIDRTVVRIREAKARDLPVILAFGAHTIKNGLAPVIISLMEQGWITHLCTNGAGIIHDWEFAFQGRSSEDVRENIKKGQFGIWHETGFYINLALLVGAYEGLGYGESIGKMIRREGLMIPGIEALNKEAISKIETDTDLAAAAIDLSGALKEYGILPGFMKIPHRFKKYSVQGRAYELGIPFTGHPMIGHDIIYTHPLNSGAAIGRTALTDFLCFAETIRNLGEGVYISLGSAVMSPMIFEKAFSMAMNIKLQENASIENHYVLVVDLAESKWDWKNGGEPPPSDPAYYLRFCKTFSRVGGEMNYLTADNRDFLLSLFNKLNSEIS